MAAMNSIFIRCNSVTDANQTKPLKKSADYDDSGKELRRAWEPWTEKENHVFFDSLVRNSRNWAEIAKDIGTKKKEQVSSGASVSPNTPR